ncbi:MULTISPECIES: hypothetical protein [Prochlorococcus]|uniref:hypothetical protein n=1 Tax=Prochlorococcus TaxID=1218 RepID=UPI000ACF6E1C|nr:hypothetical protein [Prochlorococcus marinus]
MLLSNKDPHAADRLAADGRQQKTAQPVSGAMVELMAAAIGKQQVPFFCVASPGWCCFKGKWGY